MKDEYKGHIFYAIVILNEDEMHTVLKQVHNDVHPLFASIETAWAYFYQHGCNLQEHCIIPVRIIEVPLDEYTIKEITAKSNP